MHLRKLGTLEPILLYKISFGSVGDLRASRVGGCIDADIPYEQRVAIDLGFSVASGAPNLRHMDMEMESTNGMFPNAAFDCCTTLSYVMQNRAGCRLLDDYPEYRLFEWYFDRLEQDNIDGLRIILASLLICCGWSSGVGRLG